MSSTTVSPGQHPVDNQGIVRASQRLLQPGVAIVRQFDVKPLLTKNVSDYSRQAFVVLNDQDAHRQPTGQLLRFAQSS